MIRRLFTVAILTFALVAGALVVGADIGARVFAEHQIADRAKASTGASSSTASINSFPFLYDLLAEGKAKQVTVHLTGVPLGPLRISRVDLKASGVHLDVGYLVHHQKARVKSVDSADARLTLTAADISAATGVQVSITGNQVTASLAGVSIPVTVGVTGGHVLTLNVEGHQIFNFDLDRSPIIPTCDMQLATANEAISLECRVSPVPPAVIAAISARTSG